MTNPYEDIIHLDRPKSRRAKMSAINRAAQFAPFAALTGYDAAIRETGRLTGKRAELDESEKAILNEQLRYLADHLAEKPEITLTYFRPDDRKDGGAYLSCRGVVRKIDPFLGILSFADEALIPIEEIFSIEFHFHEETTMAE